MDGRDDQFLCPNGTLFNQESRVCEWWFNVECKASHRNFKINADLYKSRSSYLKPILRELNLIEDLASHHNQNRPQNVLKFPQNYFGPTLGQPKQRVQFTNSYKSADEERIDPKHQVPYQPNAQDLIDAIHREVHSIHDNDQNEGDAYYQPAERYLKLV